MKHISLLLVIAAFTITGCTTTTSQSSNQKEVVYKNGIKYTIEMIPKRTLTKEQKELVMDEFGEIVAIYRLN